MAAICATVVSLRTLQAQERVLNLPVANGLIRWWPNLFDAHDAITGQEGIVMGVLPPVETGSQDETEFGALTGWVQLQPAVTNQVFSFSFWVRIHPQQAITRVLGQESAEGEWFFQSEYDSSEFGIGRDEIDGMRPKESVRLAPELWHHVVIARHDEGLTTIWVDGVRSLDGRVPHAWPASARWLTVGNILRGGNEELHGSLRDLCVFDRALTNEEIRAIYGAGLPRRVARNSAARMAAAIKAVPIDVLTNSSPRSPHRWIHKRFTTEDGLPGNIVKAVLQAKNGYLWVGTEEGLARFDGRQFRVFTSENTSAMRMIGQTVWSLAEDADGTIWAGIFGGLLRIRNLEFTAFTNGLPQRFILQALPADDGSLWIAGFNSFVPRGPCWLRRYDPVSGKSTAEVVVPGHVRRLFPTTNGVWLASEQPQQIHFWDGHSPATRVVASFDNRSSIVQLAASAPSDSKIRVWPNNEETTWAEVRLGDTGAVFHWLWDSSISRCRLGRWNGPPSVDRWLGVLRDLSRLRDGVMEKVEFGNQSPGPEIACLCGNREGGIWFGTEEDGLHFVQERLIRVFTTEDGLSGNDVRSVCRTPDGDLWISTAGGLSRWRSGELTTHGVDKLRAVASDLQGHPWFGAAASGPTALQRDRAGRGKEARFISLDLEWQDPNTLRFASDGKLWIVCERGVTWLKPDRLVMRDDRWIPDPQATEPVYGRFSVGKELPPAFPLGLIEDRDGSIWVGSLRNGLMHISDGRADVFTMKEGLPSNHCVPVYKEDSGTLWMVGEGVLTRRANGRFQSLTQKDGLPKDALLDVIEDDIGNFWISGKRGIHRVAKRELDDFFEGRLTKVQSLTLGARDGLLTPECSSLHYPTMAKTSDGKIWVATRNGLATFDPHKVQLDTQPLPAIIEELVVNRKEVREVANQSLSEMRLQPGSGNRLEVHFGAISLLMSDRIRFRHRLDGYDSEWSAPTDLRLAFYSNLKPGFYRFRVKAANEHGIWSDRETTLRFTILPFFWQTPLFYTLVAIAILALIAVFHWRHLLMQKSEQQMRHERALIEEKSRIAADMHDELGSALTRIAILGEVAKQQFSNVPEASSALAKISQSARDVASGISDLVWATNPENDTLENLTAHLREHAAVQFENTGVNANLNFPQSVPSWPVSATVRRNLLLILKEALHNVFKHYAATNVDLSLRIDGPILVLEIQDNGIGFRYPENPVGSGLGNMKKRASSLGGEFILRSRPANGTKIWIGVALDPSHSKGRSPTIV
jgi:signal transduction histidine kinase